MTTLNGYGPRAARFIPELRKDVDIVRLGNFVAIALVVLGMLSAEDGHAIPRTLLAQIPNAVSPDAASPVPGRLTVRPHEMATGTRNVQAGDQQLDSLEEYLVYVPERAVGTRRVPLVVVLHGGGGSSGISINMEREFADKYGAILLAPNSVQPGRYDAIESWGTGGLDPVKNRWGQNTYMVRTLASGGADVANIDAAMKQVLRKYAIDPDRIALIGFSDGASYALFLGRNNLDIFSRIAAMSPSVVYGGAGPQEKKTQFYVSGGIEETGEESFFQNSLQAVQELRQDGYVVKQVLALRPHQPLAEDDGHMWEWLMKSWAESGPVASPASRATADSIPLLTPDAITKMIAFWAGFDREPDSVQTTGRETYRKELVVPVGAPQLQHYLSLFTADMLALAAKYPSVAMDLKSAGLTSRQEEAYRTAILGAWATTVAEKLAGPVEATSILGKNVAFLDAHADEIGTLAGTSIWTYP